MPAGSASEGSADTHGPDQTPCTGAGRDRLAVVVHAAAVAVRDLAGFEALNSTGRGGKHLADARALWLWLCSCIGDVRPAVLAPVVGRDRTSVAHAVARIEDDDGVLATVPARVLTMCRVARELGVELSPYT